MGKVRRLREKYHVACQKSKTIELDSHSDPVVSVVQSAHGRRDSPIEQSSDSSIVSGVTISISKLKQTLHKVPNPTKVFGSVSEASVVGSKCGRSSKHTLKKDRRRARKETLLQKIDTVRKLKQESKKAFKQPKKKSNPLQLQSLIDALPLCTSNSDSNDIRKSTEKRVRIKSHQQEKNFMANLKVYQSVLSNSYYKADPTSAISNYLQRTVSQNASWVKK